MPLCKVRSWWYAIGKPKRDNKIKQTIKFLERIGYEVLTPNAATDSTGGEETKHEN